MDAILSILNNPAVLTVLPIAWGLVVKYHPSWKNVPNSIIPYATAIVAFLIKVFAPSDAVASTGVAGAAIGIIGHAASAGWQAILNSLIYATFLRNPANVVLKKN